MGAYLSNPVTDKEVDTKENADFLSISISMQGWRVEQEDSHLAVLRLENEKHGSLFGVFDGHGGSEVAKYCSLHFPELIASLPAYQNSLFKEALVQAFLKIDESLKQPDILIKLKELAGKTGEEKEENPSKEMQNEINQLLEEASLPVPEVLNRVYGDRPVVLESRTLETTSRNEGDPVELDSSDSDDDYVPHFETSAEIHADEKCVDEDKSLKKEDSNSNGTGQEESFDEMEIKDDDLADSHTDECSKDVKKLPFADGNESKECDVSDQSDIMVVCNEGEVDEEGSVSVEEEEEDDEEEDLETDNSAEDAEDDEMEELSANSLGRAYTILMNSFLERKKQGNDSSDGDGVMVSGFNSGTTAVIALLVPDGSSKSRNKLVVANAGDSRCILSRRGEVIALSNDHKPEDDVEKQRIERAGGYVSEDGRVEGGLNLSRAIGDHHYKRNDTLPLHEQMISALPDVVEEKLDLEEHDEFLFLACDGIWNSMENQDVIDFIRERLLSAPNHSPDNVRKILSELIDHCLAPNTSGDGTGCDNMTVQLVLFKNSVFYKRPLPGSPIASVPNDLNDLNDDNNNNREKGQSEATTEVRQKRSCQDVEGQQLCTGVTELSQNGCKMAKRE